MMTTQTNEENLAQQAKERFDQAYEQYEKKDFQQALQLWEQTISLYKQLPLDNPEYKNRLLAAYVNCGITVADLRRFEEAIKHYQHAIDLGKELLPLDNPDYKYKLTVSYRKYGVSLYNLRRFEEAIEHFQHAIELLTQLLPLDNPEYKNDLASAYNNCGNIVADLRRFEEAIEHFQHAIELGTQLLPLDNPEYKNDLASAYSNCGITVADLRRFEEAIEHFQQAIELGTQLLPLDNPEYKNDLASAYNNCGSSLASLRKFEEAEEAIEESLKISRELEGQGIFWYRENRENHFENAIEIYLNGSFNFLPELILEHLDPNNSGSAPQSEKMHEAALKGLQFLYSKIYYTHPELIKEIEETIKRLAEIRAQYFTGTATEARLTAQFYAENMQNFEKAEEILTQYTQKVPSDPVGHQQLGKFYKDSQQDEWALICFEKSIKVALKQKYYEDNFIFHCLQYTVNLVTDEDFPDCETPNAKELALERLEQINEWFDGFLDPFENNEKSILKNHWKIIRQNLKDEYLEWQNIYESNFKKHIEHEFHEKMKQKREAQRNILHQIIRSLEKTFAIIVETLFNSFEQHWEQREVEWEKANPEQRQAIESGILQSLQNVMIELAKKLPEKEKQAAFEALQQDFPLDLWDILKENEQNILLLAMQLKLKNFLQFAGLGFGQLVEMILLKSVFMPFKNTIQNKQLEIKAKGKLADFISGKNIGGFTLAPMVNIISQIVHRQKLEKGLEKELENLLTGYLKQLPHWDTLISQSEKDCDIRSKNLNQIKEIRNKCAHTGETPDIEDVEQIYDYVIKHSEHAFCQYFLPLFKEKI